MEAAKASFRHPAGRVSRNDRGTIRLPSLIGDRRAPSDPANSRSSRKSTTTSGDSVDGSSTGRDVNKNGSGVSSGAAGNEDDEDDDDDDLDTVMVRLQRSGPPADVLKAARKERRRLQQMGESSHRVEKRVCRWTDLRWI